MTDATTTVLPDATTVVADEYEALPKRIRDRIRADDAGCHLWTGGSSGRTLGGGTTTVDGRPQFVHRLVWELNRGPIPAGHIVVRVCRQRRCVRLDHLALTTASAWLMAIRHGKTLAA
jgi:hypothetical protein